MTDIKIAIVKLFSNFSVMKNYLSFLLTLISILGALGLAYFKGVDVSSLLPTLLGIYVVSKSTEKSAMAWAASSDPKADTGEVIKEMSK
jgi:hypothetical protein